METIWPSGPRSKYRAALTSSSFYQTSQYNRNLRQTDCAFPHLRQNTTQTWHQRSRYNKTNERKGKSLKCSIAIVIGSFVLIAAIFGLISMAIYTNIFKTDNLPQILTFSANAKILRGDRFSSHLKDKMRRYQQQLETLYRRSSVGPAFLSCVVDRFGEDAVTIYFKISLNRKKLMGATSHIEKLLKDILINDAVAKSPVFRTVRFDIKSIQIKQTSDPENSYNKMLTKSKEPKPRLGILLKTGKPNITATQELTSKKPSIVEEPEFKNEELSVIQGSFEISKTEADITEKKESNKSKIAEKTKQPKITSKTPTIVSAFVNIASGEKTTNPTTVPTKLTSLPMTILPFLFDQEPWIPIQKTTTESYETSKFEANFDTSSTVSLIELLHRKQPVYTSFTNPGLSFHSPNTETLGGSGMLGHPLPVNKIYDITESSITEPNPTQLPEKDFVQIETVQHIPTSDEPNDSLTESSISNSHLIEDKLANNSLRASNSNSEIDFRLSYSNLSSIIKNFTALSLLPFLNPSNKTAKPTLSPEESLVGQGQVEVVEEDEESLMLKTTPKTPLVTLIPVKSNSGVGRPLRPRPNISQSSEIVENRSFPSDPFYQNLNSDYTKLTKNPFKYVHTEVVTSVSSEISKVKINKNRLHDFKISNILNFESDPYLSEGTTVSNSQKLILKNSLNESELPRAPKMDPKKNFTIKGNSNLKEVIIYSVNSSISSSKNKPQSVLSEDKLKQLSIISKLNTNSTIEEKEPIISNKAISASYTINQAGFKILTKTLNKIPTFFKEDDKKTLFELNLNETECNNFTITCGNGQCLPESTRCNQLMDCSDGSDERNCTCADYLRSHSLLRKICDGVVDCWDYSDENLCEWCTSEKYVCANSKFCIDKNKICDGINDCPNGDDERQCVTVAPEIEAADDFQYYSQGYLMVRRKGKWGRVCAENFEQTIWKIRDLGQSVCKSITYQKLQSIDVVTEENSEGPFYEISYLTPNITNSSLLFNENVCDNQKFLKLQCENLECGTRPQAINQLARIVGGGNAGLGSWPWQAALYKEGEFQCGATLISDHWLISAGHCFFHSLDEHWVARLGALRRGTSLASPYEQHRSIAKIIIHSGYVDTGFINDISLLKMESSAVFSDYVRPICLPSPDTILKDGEICKVIGWGQLFEVGRIFPDTLQEVEVPVISTEECHKLTYFLSLYKVTNDMFCAGYDRGGRDACLGDSGGPLMCAKSDGRWVLQGITSNGYGCARANRPGVYTKVANYISWIQSYMDDNIQDHVNNLKTSCSGHRCPLGECLPKSRVCNGYIDCSDGSDENDCTYSE